MSAHDKTQKMLEHLRNTPMLRVAAASSKGRAELRSWEEQLEASRRANEMAMETAGEALRLIREALAEVRV